MPELLMEMFCGLLGMKAEEVPPLSDPDDDGDSSGKTDDHRVRNELNDGPQPRQTHCEQYGSRHQGRDLQSIDAIFRGDSGEDHDKGARGSSDLNAATAKQGDQ